MKAMNNEDYAAAVLAMAGDAGTFAPTATYIPEGDCIEFVFAPDDYYAERFDGLVTVYYSRETNEIVGSLIKGVKAWCNKVSTQIPGFQIDIEDGRIKLEHVFLAGLWTTSKPGKLQRRIYRKLAEAAERDGVEAQLGVS